MSNAWRHSGCVSGSGLDHTTAFHLAKVWPNSVAFNVANEAANRHALRLSTPVRTAAAVRSDDGAVAGASQRSDAQGLAIHGGDGQRSRPVGAGLSLKNVEQGPYNALNPSHTKWAPTTDKRARCACRCVPLHVQQGTGVATGTRHRR